jgi:plasmid stabilization system protein ParE
MPNSKYKVLWAPIAEQDLDNIILYIAEENPINASNTLDQIEEKSNNLIFHAHKGTIVPELKRFFIKSYLQIISKPWRIIYRISNNLVYVVAVIDSRRDLEEILLQRITQIGR